MVEFERRWEMGWVERVGEMGKARVAWLKGWLKVFAPLCQLMRGLSCVSKKWKKHVLLKEEGGILYVSMAAPKLVTRG